MTVLDTIHKLTDSINTQKCNMLIDSHLSVKIQANHSFDSVISLTKNRPEFIDPGLLEKNYFANTHQIHNGFEGILYHTQSGSVWWVFVLLLAIFLIFTFAVSRSGNLIPETFRNFFQVKERSSIFSKAKATDFEVRIVFILLAVITFGVFSFLVFHPRSQDYSFVSCLVFIGVTGVFFLIKYFLFFLLGYVFNIEASKVKLANTNYFNIVAIAGFLVFVLLVISLYSTSLINSYASHISLFIGVIIYILIVFKLFQIFFHKVVAFFYILLYLCTLEIIPLMILVGVYKELN